MLTSASRQILLITRTASTGNAPAAVSPESITQSVPSRTAFATSVASARVGRGFFTIDSSICVAVTTGLPAALHFSIMSFCARKIFSVGISMPRSPRATITPSLSSRMSSKFTRPSWFSTLEMILMDLPASPRTSRMYLTSLPLRTKDAAMKSMPLGTPQPRMSSLSFSVMVGRSTTTPGRLTFLRSPSMAVLAHLHRTVPFSGWQDSTVMTMLPSPMRISAPGTTSLGSFL
mmetsp:Transcript_7845/g.35071  ORF Transcript_7845/g.35071 Transcript_7845/m.35071 type:complete len:232 (+) Transcript_7845:2527-3222(+)